MAAYIVELIYTADIRGDGTKDDPFRSCDEYWSTTKTAHLIFRHDPVLKIVEYLGETYRLEENTK